MKIQKNLETGMSEEIAVKSLFVGLKMTKSLLSLQMKRG